MFVCRHRHSGFTSRIGRSGFFIFILMRVSLIPRALPFFYISLVAEKRTYLYPWLSLLYIVIRLRLINAMRGYNLISEPQTLEALQNAFILTYCCKIYPYYAYILITWKSKCSRGYCFYVIISFDLFIIFIDFLAIKSFLTFILLSY